MRTLLALVLIGILAAVVWYFAAGDRSPGGRGTQVSLEESAERARESVNDTLDRFNLKTEDIRRELAETGKVIRHKAREASSVISDAAEDGRITAKIKGKYVLDPDLSALAISVNTTAGVVTLSGTVSSVENVGKAMQAALDTEGVREVVSTLQVRNPR